MTRKSEKALRGLKAIIVTRYVRSGDERYRLARFLQAHGAEFVALIGHPVPTQAMKRVSVLTLWEGGKEGKRAILPRLPLFEPLSWIGDMICSLYFIGRLNRRYHIYFGMNWPYTILGILLKRLGLVQEVVLWTTEFFPRRFRNFFLNRVFHHMERFCLARADYVWSSTSAMIEERRRRGYPLGKKNKKIVVPYFVDAHFIHRLAPHLLKPNSVIYTGHFRIYFEFRVLMDALIAIKKAVPSVRLTFTSWETIPLEWKREIETRGLQDNFENIGYIHAEEEFSEELKRHQLGLALYRGDPFTNYSDPAKVKDYMARAVVPIVTRGIPFADEIEKEKAGIAVGYDSDEIADAVVRLLSDPKLFQEYRDNAFRLISKYETSSVLSRAFQEMGQILCSPQKGKT